MPTQSKLENINMQTPLKTWFYIHAWVIEWTQFELRNKRSFPNTFDGCKNRAYST